MKNIKRIIFTQGGKGGVGKTELLLSLISWYHKQGYAPLLLDFDIENTNKSGLQNFYPTAEKFDVHKEGSLDHFFDICDEDHTDIIIADLGSGAGSATYQWFNEIHNDTQELGLRFTSIGITTNDAGAVQAILKWADQLQDRVDYLTVLNEMREPGCKFEYWYQEPAVEKFQQILSPLTIRMQSRILEIQAELRNHTTTLQQIIDKETDEAFFLKTRVQARAKSYQGKLFHAFSSVSKILLPIAE